MRLDNLLLPPGVAIAVLGIVAIVITIFPLPPSQRLLRGLVLGACTILGVMEIRAIVSDRKAANAQHTKELDEQGRRFSNLQTLLIQAQQSALAVMKVQNLPASSIKKRALDLSNEILQFLVSREVHPGFGQGSYGEEPYGGVATDATFQQDTVKIFNASFGKRVSDIHDALKGEGLTDSTLDAEYKSPLNSYSIRSIAEKIGSLAERLPD
jgi:hypothetical protein